MKQLILALSLLFYGYHAAAQEVRDSVRIYFRQGKTELDLSMPGNRTALNRIADSLRSSYADSVFQLRRILVVGGASPEGSVSLNKRLSVERAESLFNYLSRYGALPDSLKTTRFLGRDWNGLIHLVERDRDIPYKGETLDLLREIAQGDAPEDAYLNRLRQLRGGAPYNYMYQNLFPELRASRLLLWYKKALNPVVPLPEPKPLVLRTDTIRIHDTIYIQTPAERRPFYMAVKTNMLYDLALVPNIGVEFYLGKRWSVAADWMYAWWKTDRRHWYWRTYGGDVEIRHWLGKKAKEKPLTGHHVGLYGGMGVFDVLRRGGVDTESRPQVATTGYLGELNNMHVYCASNIVWSLAESYLGLEAGALDELVGVVVSGIGTGRALAFNSRIKDIPSPNGQGIRLQPKYRFGCECWDPLSVVPIFSTTFTNPVTSTSNTLYVRGTGSRT